ncbi:hypothetical protein CgunFtcFv8_021582 [Champsocephalus gunnari]|uniref:Uncharacterized protein n=1 Tax=Champsocephalus gunnari TaxID=52237 RepID=A0AAN8HSG3_CHAGU|nr:hypothetical protein CgunFtcFv8_021582 [Champsocephalus gunnari]
MSLGRIIDKMKPLNATLSKLELTKLDSKSVEELREESITQSITDTSQRCLNETFIASEEQPSVDTLTAALCMLRTPPSVKERLDGAPVRKSSLEARRVTDLRPPHASSRSPRRHSVESWSGEPTKPRLLSTPPQKLTAPLRMRHPQDPHISPHRQLRSAQSASAAKRLRPNLSSDSSLPSVRAPYPPKKIDEDFLKVYHKFVCHNKSGSLNGVSCHLCARSSQASISSALAALALSPPRSV